MTVGGAQAVDSQGMLAATAALYMVFLRCETHEQLVYHVHAHLFILLDGKPQTVSAYVGIPGAPLLPKCYYWLHTHDNTEIIHIESPTTRTYTLGQFFDIWGQPLNRIDVATHPVPSAGLTVFVDGKQYDGDPRDVELKAHTQVVLELGQVGPPPSFSFPIGE